MKYGVKNIRLVSFVSLSLMIILSFSPSIAGAYMATQYSTSADFSVGNLVAFDASGQPVLASLVTSDYSGVVSSKSKGSIDIANSGTVNVLVSDVDGPIKSGSRIGVSAFAGIGTILQSGRTMVGIALESIDGGASNLWQTIKVSNGSTNSSSTVRIAQVLVQLSQDSGNSQSSGTGLVNSIQQAANNLVGHSVAIWQVIAALVIGLGSLILAFGLLFSSGRESFLSLGRNPLASDVILHGMWRILAVSVVIMLLGLTITYFILKVGS